MREPITREMHPALVPLYEEICSRGSRFHSEATDARLREYAGRACLGYIRDDDSMKKPFDAPPVIVNFFYHEELRKSAKKGTAAARRCSGPSSDKKRRW